MIKLYSTGCPRCKVVELKLAKLGKDYQVERNINILIEKGFKTAPVLEVDGKFMDFAEGIKWLNKEIQANG